MRVIQRSGGKPGTLALTSVHFLPPSRLTKSRPSSVPKYSTPALSGDSAMVVMVWPVPSVPGGFPLVKSGVSVSHLSPRLTDLKR